MKIKSKIRMLMNILLKRHGYEIRSVNVEPSFHKRMQNIEERNFTFSTVIDVGASNGCWSKDVMKYYPSAKYFLLEANPGHEEALRKFVNDNKNAKYVITAVGDTVGEILFDMEDMWGGVASYQTPTEEGNVVKIPMTSIDEQVRRNKLKPPYLIKLDTHGFEVPILEGAELALKNTNLLIIETYNFKISKECLRFFEMCSYMENKGFRCFDYCSPMWRPHDGVFWQFDIFFAPENREEFNTNKYK